MEGTLVGRCGNPAAGGGAEGLALANPGVPELGAGGRGAAAPGVTGTCGGRDGSPNPDGIG